MIKIAKKPLILVILSFFITALSLGGSFFIAEKYFFDEIFFDKSAIHGYVSDSYSLDYSSPFHYLRIRELIAIHNSHDQQKEQLLRRIVDNNHDNFVIAVIGDSNTYGQGLRNNQRYLIKLENKLNKLRPTKIYGFALPGDNLVDYYTNYKLIDKYLQPDLYILQLVENDFVVNRGSAYPTYKDNLKVLSDKCGENFFIPERLNQESKIFDLDWSKIVNTYSYPSATHPTNLCYAREIISNFDQNKTLYITMTSIIHNQCQIEAKNQKQLALKNTCKIMNKYQNLVNEAGGSILTMNVYSDSGLPREEVDVSKKEGHYSSAANNYIANTLFKEIVNNSQWNYKKHD